MDFEGGLGRIAVAETGGIGLGGLSYLMMQHLAGLEFFASLVTDKRDQIEPNSQSSGWKGTS